MQEGRSVFGFSSAAFPLLFALVLTAVLALAIGNDEDPVGAATDAQQQRTTTSELAGQVPSTIQRFANEALASEVPELLSENGEVLPASPESTTSIPSTTTPIEPVFTSGSYSVAQVIEGTIGAGDGSNPNEEAPAGLHDAPLFLPQAWNWAQGATRNAPWGNLGSNQFVEFRCAVIPEFGHTPPVDFRVNFREGAYYQFAGGTWAKAFDVALDAPSHGAYLGVPGQVNADPFASGRGSIQWRQEADGSYSAPWDPTALMMHFWASERQSPAPGQTGEFSTSEMRLQQPDGATVDLSEVRVLFQCGLDYYNTQGGQGTSVPGPGIAQYQYLTPEWDAGLWVTLPGDVPAANPADFRTWLEANPPPGVQG